MLFVELQVPEFVCDRKPLANLRIGTVNADDWSRARYPVQQPRNVVGVERLVTNHCAKASREMFDWNRRFCDSVRIEKADDQIRYLTHGDT
jgi:hypothetical protein